MRMIKYAVVLFGLVSASLALAQSPPVAAPIADPQNILHLNLSTGGAVTVELRPDKAPAHVTRIKLLTRAGFYDGLLFHRVIEGFMAQTGDPEGTGAGGSPLPDLKAEFNDLPHVRGAISMARTDLPDSANSQFFIIFQPTLRLDGKYTVFGRVLTGMQYVDAIERGEPPEAPSKIVKAWIEADGPDAPRQKLVIPTPQAASAPAPAPASIVPVPVAPPPVADAPKKGKKPKKEKKKSKSLTEAPAPKG